MAATIVSAGTAAHGDNASVVPGLPVGIQDGDTLLLLTAIRNTAAFAGAISSPGGWTVLISAGNVVLAGRVWRTGDTAPTCGFAGGSAGDTTSAQLFAVRGITLVVNLLASLTNGSAQDIAYPALTPTRTGCLVMRIGWKADDWTSVAATAGMTEIDEPSTTIGNDQGLVWNYAIQTAIAATTSGSFTVTGGAAAVSKGFAIAIGAAPILAVATQSVYPPRALLSVTELAVGDSVQLYRSVSGVRTAVRAGSSSSVTDPSFLRVDAELPFGVPVTHIAVVNGLEYAATAVTYTLTGGKVALSDAVGGRSAEVVIFAWPERTYDRAASRFRVGGRNVVVSGDLVGSQDDVSLYLETTSSVDNVMALLRAATQGVIQVRQPGGYDGVDTYWSVLSVAIRRWSQDGSDQRRILVMEVVEVESWAPTLQAAAYTYADLEAAYTGLTYADLEADYAAYLLLAQASF
jgi:hypothetical protein